MRLDTYMQQKGLNARQFAELLGVARWTVQRWAVYGEVPRPAMIAEIKRLTRGKVRPEDFYSK